MTVDQNAVQAEIDKQETRKAIYWALKAKSLPIPEDLQKDFDTPPKHVYPRTVPSWTGESV